MSTLHLGIWRSYGTAEDLGLDPDGGKWVVICEKHATVVNVPTLRAARSTRTTDFCEACMEGLPAWDDRPLIGATLAVGAARDAVSAYYPDDTTDWMER